MSPFAESPSSDVTTNASAARDLAALDAALVRCRACPRLVTWREEVATVKRAAYADQEYWGRPVPGFGPPDAALAIVGLAPGAHGANRTGRMFTGDRSGDVLYAALHDVGLASQPDSVSRDDGLTLRGVRITAPVRCAPPANKPTTDERDRCHPWLVRELQLLQPNLRAVLALGAFGWRASVLALAELGYKIGRPTPKFAHGARFDIPSANSRGDRLWLLGSYHVSQQNTFTGRLTKDMLRDVLGQAKRAAGL